MNTRPKVLAYPSPTTGRFLLLIGALLAAGLMAGETLYLGLFGDASNRLNATVFSIAGAAGVAGLGVLWLLFIPMWVSRKYNLRPAGPHLDPAIARIGELARESGVRPPRVMVGPSGQRDAFVFGLPGGYRLVLPTALVVRYRHPALFDPVVRHELAHLRRHDVLLAWLAAAVWVAAIPILLLPLLSALVRLDSSFAPSFLWRAVLVLAVIWLLRRQALRSREHDADLLAGDWRPLWTVLQNPKPRKGWQLLANHPSPQDRMNVLADPAKVGGVSLVDGLAAGFLTALLLPAIIIVAQSYLLPALLIGPVLGLTVGVGLWRQALIDHVSGGFSWPGAAVFGVVAGLLLGRWAGLATAVGDGYDEGLIAFLAVTLGAGAVLLSAGTGRLWADAAASLPGGRHSWWIAWLVNALIFGFALWALAWLPVVAELEGLSFEVLIVGAGGLIAPVTVMTLVPALVTMFALVARKRIAPVPQWLVDSPQPVFAQVARQPSLAWVLLAGVVPGLIGAFSLVVHRLIVGSPVDNPDRISRYVLWVSTGVLVALAVSFAAIVAVPRSGPAIGLLTGVLTAVITGLGMVTVNTFGFGNILNLSFWWTTISTITGIWFLGYLLMLLLSLVSWPAPWRDVPGWILVLASVITGGLMSLVVVGIATATW